MVDTFRCSLRYFIPPVLIEGLRLLLYKLRLRKPEWEYVRGGWTHYIQKHPEIKGWNVSEVLDVYKEKWPKFLSLVQGTSALSINHESDMKASTDIFGHNTVMAFAYAAALAAHKKDRLSILDWGGGIGHYNILAQVLLPGVDVEYHCKEVSFQCEYGAELLPGSHFYSDESCFKRTYDFVMASTSIHYEKEWPILLKNLADAADKYLYIAMLPTILRSPSFVFVQRAYKFGYNTEYLSWCINRTEFLRAAEGFGLELLREFAYGYQPFIYGAPEQNMYHGYLFLNPKRTKHELA